MRIPITALWLAAQSGALLFATPAASQWPWDRGASYPFDGYGRGGPVEARIWVENDQDYFRRGERMRVRFSVSDDSYVAVVHIDTEGNLDFLFPSSPWDEEYVRGGRIHTLSRASAYRGLTVRGRPGIGYFYLVASPEPLDYRYFRDGRGGPWDWSYAGRAVHGDPFWAMHQITRMLIPDWRYAPYVADYYTYYVEGRHRYPSYACSDRYLDYGWGWGWGPSYGPCDRLDYFLRANPYYYDTRLYRGDRRAYLRDYGPDDPRHRFKEGPDRVTAPERRGVMPSLRDDERRGRARGVLIPDRREVRPQTRPQVRQPPQRTPSRRRPVLERRPPVRRDTTAAVEARRPAVSRGQAEQVSRGGSSSRSSRGELRVPRRRPGG